MPKTVSIIGAGVVGTAVGRLLREKGYSILGVWSRDGGKAARAVEYIGGGTAYAEPADAARGADWVFVTTSDSGIRNTCERVARGGSFKKGALAVHMSGAQGSEELGAAKEAGARAVSVHPLQSLASVERALANLPGSYFSIEGDPEGLDEAREIVLALGGKVVMIPPGQKPLYHAGAAVASNYLVAVVDFAVTIYEALGMKREDALHAVFPLIQGTVSNIGNVGVPAALTGPIARGDVDTVGGHLRALEERLPGMLPLYIELGRHTVSVGRAKGTLGEEAGARLLEMFGSVKTQKGKGEGREC